ncbi:MAG: methyltransferase domain-containing protein [Acidobacteria bacterium]|nr:methyltransferase domain-containing protein [Acidobacteriota bacterium]
MELHPGLKRVLRNLLPRWIVDRIDPFQAEIDRLVGRAGRETDAGMKVLDAGAGELPYAPCFAHARYVALDRCVGDTRWDYGSVHVRGDVTRMPLRDDSIDRILCVVTLEHVSDPTAAILEFARVLKLGGRLYLVTPLMWEEHQVPHDYFRFTSWGLRSMLQRAGLEIESLNPVGGFFWLLGRRSVNLVAFFQSSWKWILFPPIAVIAGSVIPLICYYLDGLDREKRHTLGHSVVAVRR